jgi:ribonuclease BN (tRNA processing enzyme)
MCRRLRPISTVKSPKADFEDLMAHMKADHTPVEDVARIAQQAGVKTLVLSHLIPPFDQLLR